MKDLKKYFKQNLFTNLQILCLVGATAIVSAPALAQEGAEEDPCALAARYYQLSSAARADFRQQDAYDFLERAVDACPTYYYWQELGELATEFGEAQKNERAAEAFVAAHDMASNDSDRARSIARYAELLFHSEDPQRAMNYVIAARDMDPNSPWIADLADEITTRARNVTEEDIKRGLGDMAFKPLVLQRTEPSVAVAPSGGGSVASTAAATTVTAAEPVAPVPAAAQRSINIPLNFIVNTTELDESTRGNLVTLAETLAKDDFAGERFVFIGHADAVGDAFANLRLSQRRAEAMYDAVVSMQPSLSGRIITEGKGEQELLSQGQSAEDHRLNRRLEVFLDQD